MIRLVVIDDEVLVRKGIISCIPWNEHGIEIVGEATDGVSGLELIRRTKPHIILTDIRMPHMDGLEMIRQIQTELPHSKILILSVMEDFNTVRGALRLGIVDYVQKLLMTPEELLETVLKIKQSIERYNSSVIVKRLDRNFGEWLKGKPDHLIEQVLTDSVHFIIGKIHTELEDIKQFRTCLNQSSHKIIREALSDGGNGSYWMIIKDETETLSLRKVQEACIDLIKQNSNYCLTIGLSRILTNLEQREVGKIQAEKALMQRFYKGDRAIYNYQEKEPHQEEIVRFFDLDEYRYYFACLRKLDPEQIIEAFEHLFPTVLDDKFSPTLVMDGVIQWVSSILMFVHELGFDVRGTSLENSPFEEMRKFGTYSKLRQWCLKINETMLDLLQPLESSSRRMEINRAVQFIQTHYGDTIKVKDLAHQVGFSENYFSYLFTKEIGVSFSQFLQETRVEKAKELLSKGDKYWIDIGELVGFESPKYFSKVFKKYTGITPMQYKKEKRNNLFFIE